MTVVRDLVGLERFPKAVPFYLIGNGIAAFISVPLAGDFFFLLLILFTFKC